MTPIIKDKKYITYDEKPIYAEDYQAAQDSLKSVPTLTIMMQGPLKLEEHFTYETLKIYQKTFPNCPIILSTWETENAEEIQKIKDLGVNVLLNDAPETKGAWRVNYQIVSTQNGLKYAKQLGTEYVIKTRTDQRLYETNILEFLFNLIKKFPPYDDKKQKFRLITFSLDTFKYRLYSISDMFLFGHIDDVMLFWSCKKKEDYELPVYNNMLEYCKVHPSEVYYVTEYLKKIGHKCKWTLEDSWLAYSRYFCVIDSVTVGLYWPKYSNIVNRWRNFFGSNPELEELTFKEWFNLYVGLENKKDIPEHLIIQGWKNKNTLYFNQNLFFTDRDKYKNIWKKVYDFIFYKKINSKGYLCVKIFGIRILKVKIKKQ